MEMCARGMRMRNKSVARQFDRFFLGRILASWVNWRRSGAGVSNWRRRPWARISAPGCPLEAGVARRRPEVSPRPCCRNPGAPQAQDPVEPLRRGPSPIGRVSNSERCVSNSACATPGDQTKDFLKSLPSTVFPRAYWDMCFHTPRGAMDNESRNRVQPGGELETDFADFPNWRRPDRELETVGEG